MALIQCPECGGKLSDKADFCPHCGCPSNLMSDTNSKEFLIDETGCLIKYFGEECVKCVF